MKFLLAAISLIMLALAAIPQVAAWKKRSGAEKSFAFRFTIFTWLLGFVFVAAFIFLPNKGRVVLMLPVFLIGVSMVKWWQRSRTRLRAEAQREENFSRARRVN